MIILITFSTKEEPTSAGEHEYDATNPSVRSLVRSFRGRKVVLIIRHFSVPQLVVVVVILLPEITLLSQVVYQIHLLGIIHQ